MFYTEDFCMHHYVGFSQIGSHLYFYMCVCTSVFVCMSVCVCVCVCVMFYGAISNLIIFIFFLINNAFVTGFATTETCVIYSSNFDDSQCVGMTGRCETVRNCRISSCCFRLYFVWFRRVIYKSIIAPPCLLITLTLCTKLLLTLLSLLL